MKMKVKGIRTMAAIILISSLSVFNAYTQIEWAVQDTAQRREGIVQKKQSQNREQNQVQDKSQDQTQSKIQSRGETPTESSAKDQKANQNIKQIRSARPDMGKASGARPPRISRPSGSAVPKGMGKPGGAIRRGGR